MEVGLMMKIEPVSLSEWTDMDKKKIAALGQWVILLRPLGYESVQKKSYMEPQKPK